MKAVVGDELAILPDPSPQPGRVLVRTEAAARLAAQRRGPTLLRSSYRQIKARARKAPEILLHDGLRVLAGKTSHLIRREQRALGAQCASFTGAVIEDSSGQAGGEGHSPRCAGVAMSHPADTELVTARPEFVYPLSDELSAELGSLVLFGGMAAYAATEAISRTDGPIGITGSGVLAYLAASLVIDAERPVATVDGEDAVDAQRLQRCLGRIDGAVLRGGRAAVWIDTGAGAGARPAAVEHVIGVATPVRTLEKLWPAAGTRDAADIGDLLRDPRCISDLFYDDGDCGWPSWFQSVHFRRYLDLASRGRVCLGHPAEPVDLARLAGQALGPAIAAANASGAGVVWTRFERSGRPLQPKLVVGGAKRGHGPVKTISVVGAGEWPLGMILRQVVRNEGTSLRGACDRRPEALHLARRALPFEFVTTSYDDILADEETDMIVVAPYHGVHAPLAAAALRAGKHCFVEKPPAVNSEQLDDLIDAASGAAGFLHVGYNRRFAPATRVLLEHLGEADGPMTINIVVHGIPLPDNHWYFWPSNGNRIISNMCHFLDFALHLAAPAMPVRVSSIPSAVGRPDRNATVSVVFDDGSLASITYTDRGSDRSTTYYQSYDVLKGDVTGSLQDFRRLAIYRDGRRVARWRGALDLGHRRQMTVIADALRRQGPAPVSLAETELSARLALAAADSARTMSPVEFRSHSTLGERMPSAVSPTGAAQ